MLESSSTCASIPSPCAAGCTYILVPNLTLGSLTWMLYSPNLFVMSLKDTDPSSESICTLQLTR